MEPGRGGVDSYIRRLVSAGEVLFKLFHGDWALLGLGFGEDGTDALSGVSPVEALEPFGLLYSAMVSSQSLGLAAGWVWLTVLRLVAGCVGVARIGWGRVIVLALKVIA